MAAFPPPPTTMMAVVTTGCGGFDKLEYKSVPTPVPGPGEVLLRVLAAGVNNTEINTRMGWYSSSVKTGTNTMASGDDNKDGDGDDGDNKAAKGGDSKGSSSSSSSSSAAEDGGWNGATPFPFIQGTDCCGRVAAVGDGAEQQETLVGKRCLVRCTSAAIGKRWIGSDFDGAFAEYVKIPASEVFPVDAPGWTDAELGSIPCAYGTAENMVHRAEVRAGQRVFVPGASGGVASAVVQLCKRRGASVVVTCGKGKADALRDLLGLDLEKGGGGGDGGVKDQLFAGRFGDDGWDAFIEGIRSGSSGGGESAAEGKATGAGEAAVADAAGHVGGVDVVIDNVGGAHFTDMLSILKFGGRYVTSGAVGGPVVELDLRTLYLHDLKLIGSTAWEDPVFGNLVGYIERGEIKPLVAQTFPLSEIAAAQQELLTRRHVGKIVLVPPPPPPPPMAT